jgi:secondary thiamine-phosphate synthase enzyme
MAAHGKRWKIQLEAEFGHRDVTDDVARLVAESGVKDGIAVVSLTGSTGAVTTIEYEAGALADLRRALDALAPATDDYAHNARWGDGNGFSHVRSALLKTSLAVPVVAGRLDLGTWQQIVVLNLDNRPREREIVAVVVGSPD